MAPVVVVAGAEAGVGSGIGCGSPAVVWVFSWSFMRDAHVLGEKLSASAVRLSASARDGGGGLCALVILCEFGWDGLGGTDAVGIA